MPTDKTNNMLLMQLATADPRAYAKLAPQFEMQPLHAGEVMTLTPRSDYVYFVESGMVSLVGSTPAGGSVSVALVCNEGLTGLSQVLGGDVALHHVVVHVPGMASRVRTRAIRDTMGVSAAMQSMLLDYTQFLIHQLVQSAVCNCFHTATQRLARWLLLTAECANTDALAFTHDFIAQMVGAPRSAVSQAAAALRQDGIIDYGRGNVAITDGARLRQKGCECFGILSDARKRYLGRQKHGVSDRARQQTRS